jgi:DNA-binding GntR family transcriptional regulator
MEASVVRGLERLEPVNWETTASVIAGQIRARIMDGTFSPGSQIGEAQLASRLNVSRGPVREALQRLIQEGLLVNRRNRGVFVVSLDEEDIRDVYLARRVIEQESAKILMRREDAEAIARLGEAVDRMSAAAGKHEWPELADSDLDFHETLVRSSRSKRLQRMFGTLLVEARICLSTLESAYPVHQRLVREHGDILAAIRRGDEQRTLELIEAHLRQAVKDLIDLNG